MGGGGDALLGLGGLVRAAVDAAECDAAATCLSWEQARAGLVVGESHKRKLCTDWIYGASIMGQQSAFVASVVVCAPALTSKVTPSTCGQRRRAGA